MSNIKETKKLNFAPVLVGIFLFLRGIFLADRQDLGIENLYTMEFGFATENIAFIVLLFVCAILTALVIGKLGKKFGSAVSYLCVMLVAEPLFFAKQDNCIALFITSLGLLFILNALRDKPVIPNEITLVVFLLVSTTLLENALFLFAAPALVAYFSGGLESFFKSTKKIVMLILALVSAGAGVLINDFLMKKYPAFESFTEVFTFADSIYFKHISYENILLVVFLIPTAVFGGYFFANMLKGNDGKSSEKPYVSLIATAVAYILSVVGFILGGSDNLFTVNYIVPVAVITLLCSKNQAAENSLKKINEWVEKHLFVFISVLVILCFISIRVFYENVGNIVEFLLTV